MKRMNLRALLAILASSVLILGPTGAKAAPIIQDVVDGGLTIWYGGTLGQTFRAEDSHVSIGFLIGDGNNVAQGLNDDDLSIALYEGEGTSGSLLGLVDISGLTVGYAGWLDADFSSLTLGVNQMYTALIVDDTPAWSLDFTATNPYVGGSMITYGGIRGNLDAAFRVLPLNSVPTPTTLPLTGLALLGLGWVARRRV